MCDLYPLTGGPSRAEHAVACYDLPILTAPASYPMRLAPLSLLFCLSLLAPALSQGGELEAYARAGQTWPAAPSDAGPAPDAADLDDVASLLRADKLTAARQAALALAHRSEGRAAAAAWMVVGMVHRHEGHQNLAAEAFAEVRGLQGPLAAWGAYYEAEADLARGLPERAAEGCRRYLRTWPGAPHVEDCLRVSALANAQLGDVETAMKAAESWRARVPHASIVEPVQLALAEWESEHAPDRAIRRLQPLTATFVAPMTAVHAEAVLGRMRAAGHDQAIVHKTPAAMMARATSLRQSGRLDGAWDLFKAMKARALEVPELLAWTQREHTTFAWRTRQWDELQQVYQERYADRPRGDTAWSGFRAASRGGHTEEAVAWYRLGRSKHPTDRAWRSNVQTRGSAMLLAGEFDLARDAFDERASLSGWSGRFYAYFAAFSALRGGHIDDAVRRFSNLIDRNCEVELQSRYWRAVALEESAPDRAAADRKWVLERGHDTWYGLLLRNAGRDRSHDGTWPFRSPPLLVRAATALTAGPPRPGPVSSPVERPASPGFATFRWPEASPAGDSTTRAGAGLGVTLEGAASASLTPEAATEQEEAPAPQDLQAEPDEGSEDQAAPVHPYNPELAQTASAAFMERWSGRWPELAAIHDLSLAGLDDLSGPAFVEWYSTYRDAKRRRDRSARTLSSSTTGTTWRDLFLFTRDHYDTARILNRVWTRLPMPHQQDVHELALPLANRRTVWREARAHNIDPYMVLALMRAESTYNVRAVSPVGARGPMQIMPRTGALLAWIEGNPAFTAGDLHDPDTAIRYGVKYLALLQERFGGAFPLVLAAYNGGPHNVSAWLNGTGMDVPIDMFVESIPFTESRRYVRKVVGYYADYVSLYEGHDASIWLPNTPLADDRTVVDF